MVAAGGVGELQRMYEEAEAFAMSWTVWVLESTLARVVGSEEKSQDGHRKKRGTEKK